MVDEIEEKGSDWWSDAGGYLGLNRDKIVCMYCEEKKEAGISFYLVDKHLHFCPDCVEKILQYLVAVTKEYHHTHYTQFAKGNK